jgi:hypothetical protein
MTHAILTAGGSTPTLGRPPTSPTESFSRAIQRPRKYRRGRLFNRQHPVVDVLLSNITESGEGLDLSEVARETSGYQRSYDKEISIIGLRFTVVVPT